MAGKKKSKTEELPDEYSIQLGFIKEFEYLSPSHAAGMNNHPKIGRVYRLIKDGSGYRLHIGRDNNEIGLDGIFLGTNLEGQQSDFRFNILLVDDTNIITLPITRDDNLKILEWFNNENQDLWSILRSEASGKTSVIGKSLSDIADMIRKNLQQDLDMPKLPRIEEIIDIEITPALEPARSVGDDPEEETFKLDLRLNKALDTIYFKDPELLKQLVEISEFLAANLKDKYENTNMTNFSKDFIMNSGELGKGANIFSALKYLQRYSTTGFSKSNNPADLKKAIHYIIFELQRRQNQSEK